MPRPPARYRDIADEVRHKIKSGAQGHTPGEYLRVIELTDEYWCARNTATASLRQLEGEGFLTRVSGQNGWRVLSPEHGHKTELIVLVGNPDAECREWCLGILVDYRAAYDAILGGEPELAR